MDIARLTPFIRHHLDILFVGLNPPVQSNNHGHYFSGKQSRFYHLLTVSGLLIAPVDKQIADTIVFGGTQVNYQSSHYGVIDLIPHLIETNSAKVRATHDHVHILLQAINAYAPRFVCIIHGKVKDVINKANHPRVMKQLAYGNNGAILQDCPSHFFVNYFPNGNAISDQEKVRIFIELKALL